MQMGRGDQPVAAVVARPASHPDLPRMRRHGQCQPRHAQAGALHQRVRGRVVPALPPRSRARPAHRAATPPRHRAGCAGAGRSWRRASGGWLAALALCGRRLRATQCRALRPCSRCGPRPLMSMAGSRPAIRSATTRAEPQDNAQPLEPWPRLSQMPGQRLCAQHRRTVGQHRPRAFPGAGLRQPRCAGKPVVQHLVQRGAVRCGVHAARRRRPVRRCRPRGCAGPGARWRP